MRITAVIIIILATFRFILGYSVSTKVAHLQADSSWSNGIWQKKKVWKPRWVKTWQERKYYVATWKKVWGPVEINEWIPLPKPPPGWSKLPHS